MAIRMMVIHHTTGHGPNYHFCRVQCTEEEMDRGKHYELAEKDAHDSGCQNVLTSFSEQEEPDYMFFDHNYVRQLAFSHQTWWDNTNLLAA